MVASFSNGGSRKFQKAFVEMNKLLSEIGK